MHDCFCAGDNPMKRENFGNPYQGEGSGCQGQDTMYDEKFEGFGNQGMYGEETASTFGGEGQFAGGGFAPNRGMQPNTVPSSGGSACDPINIIPGQNRVFRSDYSLNGSRNKIQHNNYYRNYYTRYNRYLVNTTNYIKSYLRDVNLYYYSCNTVYEGCQYLGSTCVNCGTVTCQPF